MKPRLSLVARRRLALAFALSFGVPACVGTDTGNPPVAASLTARSSDPSVAVAPARGDVVIEQAWISLTELRVTLGAACDHVSDPYDRDVVGDVVVGRPLAGLPDEPICGVHLTLAARSELPAGAPPGLVDRTLFITGSLADGTPFEISSALATSIAVSAPAPFELSPDAGALITFDVAPWLAGLDLAGLARDPDGVIRLASGDAELSRFEASFQTSVELYEDLDGDGALDPAELAMGPHANSHPP